jgi:hypothetical protein
MDNQQPKEKKSNLFFAYGSPQFVIGATLLNMFLNWEPDPNGKLSIEEEKQIKTSAERFVKFLFIFILFLALCGWGLIFSRSETYKKHFQGDYETADEMKIKSEIAAQQAVAEFKVWQEWDSKLTKSQRDSIKRSSDKAYENSNPKCPKCHRLFENVWSDPKIDYIDGVGQVCTHCYIEYYKKHKK